MGDEAWDEYEEHKMENWEGSPSSEDFSPNISRFGRRFAKIKMADIQLDTSEDPTPVVNKYFPIEEFEDVIWLNEARHEGWEFQVVNLRNGNEASLMWHYSHAAILVDVPGWEERVLREPGVFPDFRRGGEEGKGKSRA
jgi:hypothetical protein